MRLDQSGSYSTTHWWAKLGDKTVSIDFEAGALNVLLGCAVSVKTEDLGNGVLIDRCVDTGEIVNVEVILGAVAR